MISRNERAVAEATSWLKRIVVTWIVLNTLGFVVAYLQPLIQGGQYTPSTTPDSRKSKIKPEEDMSVKNKILSLTASLLLLTMLTLPAGAVS